MCKKTDKSDQILKVHELDMKTVSLATYLGDVISDTGTIDATVAERCQKAIGLITQISSILSSISLGNFHFDIAMVLRESEFVIIELTNWDSLKTIAMSKWKYPRVILDNSEDIWVINPMAFWHIWATVASIVPVSLITSPR